MKKLLYLLPFIAFFTLILMFQGIPLLWVIINSFRVEGAWGLGNYIEIFSESYYQQSITNSMELALYSPIICLAIAFTVSHAINQSQRFGHYILAFINMLSNFAGVPLAFAFIIILGLNGTITDLLIRSGVIESFDLYSKTGLILLYIYFQIPLSVLLLYPSFDAIQHEWKESAALLGARPITFWRYIGLPILFRPILTTLVILFADAMGTYATAFALTSGSYNLLTLRISGLVASDLYPDPGLASALSMVLVCSILIIACIAQLTLRNRRYAA